MASVEARVVAIHGPSFYLVKQALDTYLEQCSTGAEDFDFSEMDAIETEAAEVIGSVTTSPFFGEKRTVVLRRADKLNAEDVLKMENAMANLPTYSRLVLVFEGEELSANSKKLTQRAKSEGVEIKCVAPSSDALAAELIERAKKMTISLERPAAKLLCDMVSADPSDAINELDNLCLICAESGRIQSDDVQKYATSSREHKIFSLVDAVCAANMTQAMHQMDLLVSSAKDVAGSAMQSVLPLIHRQLRLIYQAKAIEAERIGVDSERASAICPSQHSYLSLYKKGGFPVDKIKAGAKRLDWRQLQSLFDILATTDMRLKGYKAEAGAKDTLERMVMEMCKAVSTRTHHHG